MQHPHSGTHGAAGVARGAGGGGRGAGLAATAEVMQLNATLTHLAAQRGALVAAAAAPDFDDLRFELQEYSAETGDSIAEVVRRLEAARAQKSEGEAYRGEPPAPPAPRCGLPPPLRDPCFCCRSGCACAKGNLLMVGLCALRDHLNGAHPASPHCPTPCHPRGTAASSAGGLPGPPGSEEKGRCAAAKLAEMGQALDEVVGTISRMEHRKAALLQELEVLDQKLFKVPPAPPPPPRAAPACCAPSPEPPCTEGEPAELPGAVQDGCGSARAALLRWWGPPGGWEACGAKQGWGVVRQAKVQWADLDEGRNVFEEGNAFTMEAVQQQLDQLLACQNCQVAGHPPLRPRCLGFNHHQLCLAPMIVL